LRAAGLSISNNIAEGSGSRSNKDFVNFLYIVRKSAFECARMLMIFQRRNYCDKQRAEPLIDELETLSKMIVSFADKLT
jgi:four helix bundle protein